MLFYIDAMLGKLGRFLRILGFDTEIAESIILDDDIIAYILSSNRILITSNYSFYQIFSKKNYTNDQPAQTLLMTEKNLISQLILIFKTFSINNSFLDFQNPQKFIKRCSKCNYSIVKTEKEQIKSFVEVGTFNYYEDFWQCTNKNCQSVYWIGAHWQNILSTFKQVQEKLIS